MRIVKKGQATMVRTDPHHQTGQTVVNIDNSGMCLVMLTT